jgi:hypothetical protein
LKPDQRLALHMEGSHANALIQRRLVIVEEFIEGPPRPEPGDEPPGHHIHPVILGYVDSGRQNR